MPRPAHYKPRYKIEHVAEALRKGAGIPSAAAKILGQAYGRSVTADTIREYMKRHPKLRDEVEAQIEEHLDMAEAKLLTAINAGADWAVKFYLETQGKRRGYSRRQEIAGVPGQPVVVTDARQWLVAQLDQMGERLRLEPSRESGPAASGGESKTPEETVH
jgi:hypothetical protein